MKKKFLKNLAFALAAATVISSAAPASFVSGAAKAPSISRKSKNLYLNNESVGKSYDFNINNKVKGSKYAWSSTDTTVATVNSKGVVTGKKVGSVTISCKITLPNKKTQTIKASVNVKANSTAVAVKNPVETIGIGENVYDFNRTLTASDSTDKTAWFITDDTAGTTISSKGVVSTTNAGKFTLTAKTYQNKDEKAAENWTSVSEPITVIVASSMKDAKQTHANKIELTFDDNMKETLTKDKLSIVDNQGVSHVINDLEFSNDGKVVTVSSYVNYKNDVTYTVSYNNNKIDFLAKVGDVAKVVLNGGVVQYNIEKEIDFKLLDENGIDVTSGKEDSVSFETNNGSIDGRKLVLFNIGDTAKVKATFHSGKYTTAGEEITVVSDEVVYTAVEKIDTTIDITSHTISDSTPDWSKTPVHTIPADTEGYSIFVKGKNSKGEEVNNIDNPDDFKFSSADDSKLIVQADGSLYSVAAGATYVKVEYGATTKMLPVTIGAKATASKISVNKSSVTVSNSAEVNEEANFTVKVVDQYDNEMSSDDAVVVESLERPKSVDKTVAEGYMDASGKKATFKAAGATDGTYKYKLTYLDKSITVSLTVRTPKKDVSTIRVVLSETSVDTVYDKEMLDNVEMKVYEFDSNGIKINERTDVKFTVVGPDGKSNAVEGSDANKVVSGSAIAVHSKDGNDLIKAAKGKYTVKVEGKLATENNGEKAVATSVLEVKDTQKAPSYRRTELAVDSSGNVLNTIKEAIEVKVGNKKAGEDGLEITGVDYRTASGATTDANGNKANFDGDDIFDRTGNITITIRELTVKETIDGVVVTHTVKPATSQANITVRN